MARFHTASDFVVKIAEFPETVFSAFSGGSKSTDVTLHHPSGQEPPEPIDGVEKVEPITLTKAHDVASDARLIRWLKASPATRFPKRLTVTKVTVSKGGKRIGSPDTYHECALTEFVPPDYAAESSEAAMISLTLQPKRMS